MNFSGYVGHVTVFRWMLTVACCLVVGLKLGLGLGLGLVLLSGWSVYSYAHVYIQMFVFNVSLPLLYASVATREHISCHKMSESCSLSLAFVARAYMIDRRVRYSTCNSIRICLVVERQFLLFASNARRWNERWWMAMTDRRWDRDQVPHHSLCSLRCCAHVKCLPVNSVLLDGRICPSVQSALESWPMRSEIFNDRLDTMDRQSFSTARGQQDKATRSTLEVSDKAFLVYSSRRNVVVK